MVARGWQERQGDTSGKIEVGGRGDVKAGSSRTIRLHNNCLLSRHALLCTMHISFHTITL